MKCIESNANGRSGKPGFSVNTKDSGDVLTAQDWNDMQEGVFSDLARVLAEQDRVKGCGDLLMATGITSHGLVADLGWDAVLHVTAVQCALIRDLRPPWNRDVMPVLTTSCRIIGPGRFKVICHCEDDSVWGVVHWMALGVSRC